MAPKKIIFFLLFVFIAQQHSAHAADLNFTDAMRYAAAHQPALQAAQATLRAADEQYAGAQSGWRPSLNAEGDVGWSEIKDDAFSAQTTHGVTKGGSIIFDQPLYRGGKTTAEVARARHQILAARATYTQTAAEILLRAGTAYADLVRDRALLDLNRQDETRLQNQLTAAQQRFHSGDATISDVDQAQARLARSDAELIRAHNALNVASAAYESTIGLPVADELALPLSPIQLPENAAAAEQLALANNPSLLAAREQAQAATASVRSDYSDLLPQFSAFASYDNQYQPQYGVVDHATTGAAGLRARLALYDGGISRAALRAGKDNAAARQFDVDDTMRIVRETVARQWQDWQAQNAIARAAQTEWQAALAANNAVTAEAKIGARPLIDVLDADQDLLSAQGNVFAAQHDGFVAGLALAATIGQLTPEQFGVTPPDAMRHLVETTHKIFTLNPN